MAKTADNKGEQRTGILPRPISDAMAELRQLLDKKGTVTADALPIVAELEAGYASVDRAFGVAVQHEADAANTMGNIRKILSDPRLGKLGIYTKFASKPISRPDNMRDCS